MPVWMRRRLELLGAIALSTLAGACASGGTPYPFPMPSPPVPIVERPVTAPPELTPEAPPPADRPEPILTLAQTIVQTALGLRGVPYRNGGADPAGFDCSGFTQYVFAQVGAHLPRDTREQFQKGAKIKRDDLQPGDLVFFATTSKHVSHVGIVLDETHFVHAPNARGVVRIESMDLPYWKRRFVGVKRMLEAN